MARGQGAGLAHVERRPELPRPHRRPPAVLGSNLERLRAIALSRRRGARLATNTVAIPAVNIVAPLADILFEPLAARQNVDRTRFDAAATANTILLDVATLHVDLVGAEA